VAGEDDGRACRQQVAQSGQRGPDAGIVSDIAAVHGDIVIDPHQHFFAGKVDVADGFLIHGGHLHKASGEAHGKRRKEKPACAGTSDAGESLLLLYSQ
jgi:hypothetical protein